MPLLLSLLLIILVYPVLDQGEIRRMILGLLVFIPVILPTFRLSAIKAWVWPAVLLMSGAFFFPVLSTIHHSTTLTGIKWAFLTVFFGLTVSGLFSYLKNARTISDSHLCTAISIYLLLGLPWFALYSALDAFYADALLRNYATLTDRSSEQLYFSLVTLPTIGYGDVVPIGGGVRMLAALQGITGVLYIAITVAILVGACRTRNHGAKPNTKKRTRYHQTETGEPMMRNSCNAISNNSARAVAVVIASLFALGAVAALAQSPQMLDKLMTLKSNQENNKQKLAQYTWQETETISVKGNVKDTKVYQVSMVNGQQQKTEVSNQQAEQSGREGRLKKHAVEHVKDEYTQYGQSIAALAKQYTTPNPEALIAAKNAGNVSLVSGTGTADLVIKNYVKQGDSITFTIDPQTKQLQNVHVASYLNDPKDAVTINATFAQLPDGTNHVASTLINGVSKQLTVNDVNSNYQKQ